MTLKKNYLKFIYSFLFIFIFSSNAKANTTTIIKICRIKSIICKF